MRILPVIDLKGGLVVRGIAGRRAEYRPVVSTLTSSAEPLAVARAFRDRYGLSELYLADLDAIAGATPAIPVYAALRAAGFRLWVDAGVQELVDAGRLADAVDGLVVGLETLSGPECLAEIVQALGPARIVFSLDLKEGQPLGRTAAWRGCAPPAIAGQAIDQGVGTLLVLDLARVGTGSGAGSEALCAALRRQHPAIEIWAGGGIRDRHDLRRLAASGIDAVLVASALHDGRLTPADLI